MAALVSIPWEPLRLRLGPGAFGLPELTVLIGLVAVVWSRWITPPRDRRAAGSGFCLMDAAVIALAVAAVASCFWAVYQREALRELRVAVLEPVLLYGLIRASRPSPGGLRRAADLLALTGTSVALFALAVYPTSAGVILAEGVRRARAFYGSPNNLALVLVRVLPLAMASALWASSRKRRWLFGLASLIIGLALVLTFSRGALLIGLPVGLAALLLLRGRRARWLLLALVGLGLALLLALWGTERLSSLADPTSGTTFLRLSLWQSSLQMARDHPLLGVGLDNFLYYYGDYIRPEAMVDRWLSHPHNVVLDFWLRMGLPGLASLGLLLAGVSRAALAARRLTPASEARAAVIGLAVGILAGLAHGLIDAWFFVPELAYWFLVSAALLTNSASARPGLVAEGGSEQPVVSP